MRKRLRDESGIALPLAIMVMVIIGVMGAGLLVFVRNDLEAVAEVNRGQKAFEIAEAGVQSAKRQLRSDKLRAHYDVDTTTDPDHIATSCNVTDESAAPPIIGEAWSLEGEGDVEGITRTFGGGRFTVTIRWLSPNPTAPSQCVAPQTGTLPEGVDYFEVVSTGAYGDAKRQVKAIYDTYDIGVPKAYFSARETIASIQIGGNACIKNVSLFTLGSVTRGGQGGCDLPGGGKSHIQGTDIAYGNWLNPPFNTTQRPVDDAGFGAVGTVQNKVAGRDFDRDQTTTPSFIKKDPPDGSQTSTQISFPFDYRKQQGQQDVDNINFWREEAMRQEAETGQNHYQELSGSNPGLTQWPSSSSPTTVVFVRLTNAGTTLNWDVPGQCSDNPPKRGILVVENGNFTTQPGKARFEGAVIIRGGQLTDGDFVSTGNVCLDGFANAEDEIKINGNVNTGATPDVTNSPGFYGVRLWSWRECYNTTCS